MATITREQAIKLENQAPENWHFDWKYFVLWNEKTIYRSIETEDGGELRAKLLTRQALHVVLFLQ